MGFMSILTAAHKTGKKASKTDSKHQKVKPFSTQKIKVDMQLLMLKHKFDMEDAKEEQKKRKSNF